MTESNSTNFKLSYIIPALNEENCIRKTLFSINEFTPDNVYYQVILVDNGSTDNTINIAKKSGAKVKSCPQKTIAYARNFGAKDATGDIFVFLDADILLTEEWASEINNTLACLSEQRLMVTGSRVLPVDNITLLNKYWFYRMLSYEAPYINSAHLITTKELFVKIEGFTAELKTAEDYDFCMKAKKAGAELVNNPSLPVIHLGYPTKIPAFMKRERWHGRQDFVSIQSFMESKIAWLATINIVSFIFYVLLSIGLSNYAILLLYPLTMGGFSALLTVYKFGMRPLSLLLGTSLLFYFYLCGRSMALIDRFVKP